jgi:hypothetical protein
MRQRIYSLALEFEFVSAPIPLDDYLAKIQIIVNFTLFSGGSLMAEWE